MGVRACLIIIIIFILYLGTSACGGWQLQLAARNSCKYKMKLQVFFQFSASVKLSETLFTRHVKLTNTGGKKLAVAWETVFSIFSISGC